MKCLFPIAEREVYLVPVADAIILQLGQALCGPKQIYSGGGRTVTRKEVFEKLNSIFRNNFDDEDIVLSEETSSADIEDWDSLEQINLIVAIQDVFGVKFNISEVAMLKSVGEMADLIIKKLGA